MNIEVTHTVKVCIFSDIIATAAGWTLHFFFGDFSFALSFRGDSTITPDSFSQLSEASISEDDTTVSVVCLCLVPPDTRAPRCLVSPE